MKAFFSLFWVICFANLFAQKFNLKDSVVLDVPGTINDFAVDDFNNIYFIRNNTELNKIDYSTKTRKTFSNQTILENLNTQNILQITLKSAFFNLIVLDNQLNLVQDPIQFPIETNFSPTLTALVDNNFLWGYDPVLQRLVLWNYREKKAIRQSVLLSERTADEFFPELIYHQNRIYLISYSKCLVFDEYANLIAVIPFQEFEQLQFLSDKIYFTKGKDLFQYDINTKSFDKVELPFEFEYFSINNRFLFVLNNKVVYLYQLQKEY